MNAEFWAVVTEYFRTPEPRRMADLFLSLDVDESLRAETVLVLPVFLSLILDQDPQVADDLVASLVGGNGVKVEILAQALNYSHLPKRARLMERLVGESAAAQMDESGADFIALQAVHPAHVEMKWLAFFATGDQAYLHQLTELLAGWVPDQTLADLIERAAGEAEVQKQAMDGVLAATALQGLQHYAISVPEVRAALYQRAVRHDGLAAAMAARVLAVTRDQALAAAQAAGLDTSEDTEA